MGKERVSDGLWHFNAFYQLETGLTRHFIVSAGERTRGNSAVLLAKGHHRGHFVCPRERISRGAWVCLIYSKGTPEGPMLFFCLLKGHPRGTGKATNRALHCFNSQERQPRAQSLERHPRNCVLSAVKTPQRALYWVAPSGGCLFQHHILLWTLFWLGTKLCVQSISAIWQHM